MMSHKRLNQSALLIWLQTVFRVVNCLVKAITGERTFASKPSQVEENAEASGVKLDEATVRRVEDVLR
jgi:hypothetical protein